MNIKGIIRFAVVVVLTVITVIIGFLFENSLKDCGVSRLTSVEDIEGLNARITYAMGSMEEEENLINDEFWLDLINGEYGINNAPIAAIVKPTGTIRQTDSNLGQEVIIKQVIRGTSSLFVNDRIIVYMTYGFTEKNGTVLFQNQMNLMYPEHDYLIFLEESPLNKYQIEKAFVLFNECIGYIRVDEHTTKTLNTDWMNSDMALLRSEEYFSCSENVTKCFNDHLDRICASFLDDNHEVIKSDYENGKLLLDIWGKPDYWNPFQADDSLNIETKIVKVLGHICEKYNYSICMLLTPDAGSLTAIDQSASVDDLINYIKGIDIDDPYQIYIVVVGEIPKVKIIITDEELSYIRTDMISEGLIRDELPGGAYILVNELIDRLSNEIFNHVLQ